MAGRKPRITSPAVVRRWKRLIAVGCSHGSMIDPIAERTVLKLSERWKPDTRVHLGDFVDTATFRAGAHGTADEGKDIAPDMQAGMDFLRLYRATHILTGNHEIRLWRFLEHHDAKVRYVAQNLIEEIHKTARDIGARFNTDYSVVKRPWFEFGGWKFLHGFFFNSEACRDHAEAFGNCVFAHTHRSGMAPGRRVDKPNGICVGTLSDIPNMDYAATRRATLGWRQAVVIGEYTDTEAVMWLCEKGETEWRLPV